MLHLPPFVVLEGALRLQMRANPLLLLLLLTEASMIRIMNLQVGISGSSDCCDHD
jgi:hypothetical protein